MKQIERVLREKIGLNAASIGSSLLERTIRLRLKRHGLRSPEEYQKLLQSSQAEWNELMESVLVTETWFFRDHEPFAALTRLLMDEWLPSNPVGRACLLSLPCSSGEEPFSLAMALLDAGLSPERFQIDALDISAQALARARRATYGKNSFRGKNLAFRQRYFKEEPEGFVLRPIVRNCVRFQQGNVLNEYLRTPSNSYDFIFCRNLLIYFDEPTQQKALSKLHTLLSPEGMIFVGAAEQPLVLGHGFVSAQIPMAFAFRKSDAPPAPKRSRPNPTKMIKPVWATRPPVNGNPAPLRQAPAKPITKPITPKSDSELEAAKRLADAGQFKEATECCEAFLRVNGASAQAYYLLGLVRDASGDSAAADYYRKALYLDPNHYESLLQMGLWLERRGEAGQARRFKMRAQRVLSKLNVQS